MFVVFPPLKFADVLTFVHEFGFLKFFAFLKDFISSFFYIVEKLFATLIVCVSSGQDILNNISLIFFDFGKWRLFLAS